MMQNAYMARKNSTMTLRLPESLRRRVAQRAKREHRSLSAQLVHDLEAALGEAEAEESLDGRFLGLYAGTRVPTDEDFKQARALLWGSLASRSHE
jgi:Arc-like DNA binding domain